jgi:hypothetical protein
VPGGAIQPDGTWKAAKKYLFPIKVLSKLFKGIFVSKLRVLYQNNQLKLPEQLSKTLSSNHFNKLLDLLMGKEWVVYAKPPFADSETLLNYLGRYTHKIAISNSRIIACDEEFVTFKWRDYADGNKEKVMKLKADEFIRRFLAHVVPTGYMRIRSFGFLSNASKAKKIKLIKEQLNVESTPTRSKEKKNVATMMLELTGKDITLCPFCGQGKLKRIGVLSSKFSHTLFDTS